MKRVFLIVLDSLGIGGMPDAAAFGDDACNTLARIAKSDKFHIPNLLSLGMGGIDGVNGLPKNSPRALLARMREQSKGKDTTIGHWEIAGLVSDRPLPTFPDGFPREVIDRFSTAVGRAVLCNKPYSGTEVIADYGREHMQTGALIVYTSADSVFQIAAHEEIVPTQKLYEYCEIARAQLVGEYAVGRVIARPFAGKAPNFTRTAARRDFSLAPPKATLLNALSEQGKDVIAVGKISDIFAGSGITQPVRTHSNAEGMAQTLSMLKKNFEGLCFTNLVDFDMLFGHRQDTDGYAAALSAFDAWLPSFIQGMWDEDVLMITADHGCDPGDESTDHTREYTPFICFGKNIPPQNLGTRESFADIAATVADCLDIDFTCPGKSMIKEIKR